MPSGLPAHAIEPRVDAWIVDDSPLEAEAIRSHLAQQADVRVFSDGAAVLEELASGARPDVLLLDWVMPGLSGIELCTHIRASGHAELPILMVTGQWDAAHVVEGLAAGANDFLKKPFEPAELLARVASLMRARRLLERAERAEHVLRHYLLQLPDALLAVNAAGRIVLSNDEALSMLGRERAEVDGAVFHDVLPELPLDLAELARAKGPMPLPDLVKGDRVYEPLVREIEVEGSSAVTVTFRNVTEKRRAAARRLDLYSMVAHDLRSPLTTMLMRVDWLLAGRRGPLSADVEADVTKIEARIRDLVTMINDFLELARLENAGIRIERASLDLQAVARSVVEEFAHAAQASGVALELALPEEPSLVVGEESRLDQVLTNLLANALKHTPRGGRVTLRLDHDEERVHAHVEDTGTGIAPELLPRVFERYTRGAQAGVSTGLGLMIVREIVEAHGGTVGVRSTPGRGSTFSVELPRQRASVKRRRRSHGQVLVVEDEPEFREIVVEFLEGEGLHVRSAEHGIEALAHLGAGYRPDVILMDLAMPVMSGWQLREILAETPDLADIPVVVVTGESRACASELKAVAVLPKTVSPNHLGALCRELVARQQVEA